MMHSGISPGLAFLLGLIPGVGAIYNGQYVKGLVHAAIFGLLMTIAQNGQSPLIVMFVAAFYCYMPFEAYHTARKRQLGVPVEEWSSLMGPKLPASPVPIGPIILILIGVLFLLNSLDLLDMHAVVRFWPVLLIVGGIAMLVARLRSPRADRTAAAGFQAAPVSETARER
jgi:TM2 domain-containing membrane protein YozV